MYKNEMITMHVECHRHTVGLCRGQSKKCVALDRSYDKYGFLVQHRASYKCNGLRNGLCSKRSELMISSCKPGTLEFDRWKTGFIQRAMVLNMKYLWFQQETMVNRSNTYRSNAYRVRLSDHSCGNSQTRWDLRPTIVCSTGKGATRNHDGNDNSSSTSSNEGEKTAKETRDGTEDAFLRKPKDTSNLMNYEDWDILNSPGLTPPRGKFDPSAGIFSRLGYIVWRRVAVWFPALASVELLRRISVTFFMLWLIRLGNYIPVPGMNVPLLLSLSGFAKENSMLPGSENSPLDDVGSVADIDRIQNNANLDNIASLTSKVTGAAEIPGSVYLLSITPYMSAQFFLGILQLLPEVRRHFKILRDQGRSGQDTINGYVNILFIGFALVEAFWQSARLVPLSQAATQLTSTSAEVASHAGNSILRNLSSVFGSLWSFISGIYNSELFFRFQTIMTLLAGAVICKYVVQTIDKFGLGDGTGIIIGASIAIGYWQHLQVASSILISQPQSLIGTVAGFVLVFALVAVVVWVQGIELRLPLTSFVARQNTALATSQHPILRMLSRLDRNRIEGEESPMYSRQEGNYSDIEKPIHARNSLHQGSVLPLRLSPSGARQLLFANFWVGLLDRPLSMLGLGNLINMKDPWVFAFLVFFLEAVSFADATPRQTAEFLMQSDTGILGLSPGPDTEQFLQKRRRQMKLLNAGFVALVSLVARAVDAVFCSLTGVRPDCLSLLLLVSTIIGGARQFDALSLGVKVERMIDHEYTILEKALPKTRLQS